MNQIDQLYAEDFRVGDRFDGATNTMSEDDFRRFAEITGDNHPIHYDEAYAKQSRFGARIAHGLLIMSMTVLGATDLSARLSAAMVAFIDQGCRFVKPVFIGDTVRSAFEVTEVKIKPDREDGLVRFAVTLTNQRDETVLDGYHVYLLRRRPSE